MAGITKEERLRRAAASEGNVSDNTSLEQNNDMVPMFIQAPEFPGGPTEADVHLNEVDAWKEHGWRVKG